MPPAPQAGRPRLPLLAEAWYAAQLQSMAAVVALDLRSELDPVLRRYAQQQAREDAGAIELRGDDLEGDLAAALAAVRVTWSREVTVQRVESIATTAAGKIDAFNAADQTRVFRGIAVNDVFKSEAHLGKQLPGWLRDNTDLIVRGGVVNGRPVVPLGELEIQRIGGIVREGFTAGTRHEVLARRIDEALGIGERRALLIARDQTNKLNGQLTEARQRAVGVERYTWQTAQDRRVRDDHAMLQGQEFAWDKPPSIGHPGQPIQCRCVAVPVLAPLVDRQGKQITSSAQALSSVRGEFAAAAQAAAQATAAAAQAQAASKATTAAQATEATSTAAQAMRAEADKLLTEAQGLGGGPWPDAAAELHKAEQLQAQISAAAQAVEQQLAIARQAVAELAKLEGLGAANAAADAARLAELTAGVHATNAADWLAQLRDRLQAAKQLAKAAEDAAAAASKAAKAAASKAAKAAKAAQATLLAPTHSQVVGLAANGQGGLTVALADGQAFTAKAGANGGVLSVGLTKQQFLAARIAQLTGAQHGHSLANATSYAEGEWASWGHLGIGEAKVGKVASKAPKAAAVKIGKGVPPLLPGTEAAHGLDAVAFVEPSKARTQPLFVDGSVPARQFRPWNAQQVEFGNLHAKVLESLPEPEVGAVHLYSGHNYTAINGPLRQGLPYREQWLAEATSRVDSALKRSELAADTLIYRGVGSDVAQAKLLTNGMLRVGDEFTDLAFGSSSVDRSVAVSFAGGEFSDGVVVELHAPAGTKGLWMGKWRTSAGAEKSISRYDTEAEFLLPRGTRFRVTGFEKAAPGRVGKIHAELLPPVKVPKPQVRRDQAEQRDDAARGLPPGFDTWDQVFAAIQVEHSPGTNPAKADERALWLDDSKPPTLEDAAPYLFRR